MYIYIYNHHHQRKHQAQNIATLLVNAKEWLYNIPKDLAQMKKHFDDPLIVIWLDSSIENRNPPNADNMFLLGYVCIRRALLRV